MPTKVHEVPIQSLYHVVRETSDEEKDFVVLADSPPEAAQTLADHWEDVFEEDVFEEDVTKQHLALCVYRCAASPVDPDDKTEVTITVWPLNALSKVNYKAASVLLTP